MHTIHVHVVDIEDGRLTTQQRDERRQDNGDRRRLACQHLSDLLCSLTGEWDRRKAARRRLNHALPFHQIKHVFSVRHMIHKRLPSSIIEYNCTVLRYHVNAQELLRIAQHKTSQKPSVAHQYTALHVHVLTLPDRNMPHSASYTVMMVDHSLLGITDAHANHAIL